MLEVLSIAKTSSIFSLWVEEPSFSNYTGKITFNGGAPTPGFTGANGNILSITFKAKEQGTAYVAFANGTVRKNDGLGTDITSGLIGATFNIKKAVSKPTPVSTPEPVPEAPQPLPAPKAPEIIFGIKDNAKSIIGSSGYPKAQVSVTFVAQDGTKVFILGVSDADGSFNLSIPNSLKYGSYAVTAVMIGEDKTASEASNAIIVEIGNIIFNAIWEMWLLIIIIIVLIFDLILHIYFHFGKNKNTNKFTKEKLRKTENVTHQSFDFLRDDLNDRARGIVNSVERTNIEELKKDIDSTEKIIAKEIKDIELQ